MVPDYNLRHFLSEGIKNCFEREKKWTYNLFFANKNQAKWLQEWSKGYFKPNNFEEFTNKANEWNYTQVHFAKWWNGDLDLFEAEVNFCSAFLRKYIHIWTPADV